MTEASAASWRADQRLMLIKLFLTAFFVVIPFLLDVPTSSRVLGILIGGVIAAWAVRDVIVPVRLAVDTDGLTIVTGFAGHRRLAWAEIDRVRLDARSRYGGRSELLEIDCGAELYFFSRYDLSVPPSEALDTIIAIRAVS